jgi:hypothetical protein
MTESVYLYKSGPGGFYIYTVDVDDKAEIRPALPGDVCEVLQEAGMQDQSLYQEMFARTPKFEERGQRVYLIPELNLIETLTDQGRFVTHPIPDLP